jgi:Holliday junction resolvase
LTPDEAKALHAAEAKKAADLYVANRVPHADAEVWQVALREARKKIAAALRESDMLTNVEKALTVQGAHMVVYRRLMAPPTSQDQFKLLCPEWNKGSEDEGKKLKPIAAAATAKVFHAWRHKRLTVWLDRDTAPTRRQLRHLLAAVTPIIAMQVFGTVLRNRQSREQEGAITSLLDAKGWKRLPSQLVDQGASLAAKQYMHKTRFATGDGTAQEVDVACGLGGTYVLAMECKVTNDETNSVKRVNDVLKKANAWKSHWGNFVETAALLQGVIAPKDVNRLLHAGVRVFWSHNLKAFEDWLSARI